MTVGVLSLAWVESAWIGSLLLVIGLVGLGIGWYRFVRSQRQGLWRLQTEVRNLRDRQNRLDAELSEALAEVRRDNREKVGLAVDAMRRETGRHETKLREMERLLLRIASEEDNKGDGSD